MLRGNHECQQINRMYGFYEECRRRFDGKNGIKLWKDFAQVFDALPAAAVVDDRILCMHGGLSPELSDLDVINKQLRPLDVPDQGLLCDLLWSDPEIDMTGWAENDRGVSYVFG